MLQIQNISKTYVTGDLTQTALNHVSLNLRDNEFVAVLGPSGSGKTTLLNVIGGLDRYDSGDLIINGVSTKRYKDRDWDSYRNHTIGFVFQSYNLIPHQSILANVELALTISGISRSERKRRAREALEKVGLGDQLHKRPNQMSGGQMQRVAIARALVNDPDILLADEPTGALDTETSVQVMDLLKQVAADRLVVMVTHNPELAEQYATRIVNLKDGKITNDSDPYLLEETVVQPPVHKNMGKSSMSFLTALSLSFNNLRTKKGRTILTAFAGSIGIIGIALILSLSNGVNTYISDIQKETMTSYPITIEAETIDLSSIIQERQNAVRNGGAVAEEADHELDAVYSNASRLEMAASMVTSFTTNNLTDFKAYLEDPDSEIQQYVGENGIVYSYDTRFSIFTYDPENHLVNTDGSTLEGGAMGTFTSRMGAGSMSLMSGTSSNNASELLPGQGDQLVSSAITDTFDLVYGAWPTAYDEVVLVLSRDNELPLTTLYQLGLLPASEYHDLMEQVNAGEELSLETYRISYQDVTDKAFYLIPACDIYAMNDDGTFTEITNLEGTSVTGKAESVEDLLPSSLQLRVVGIIRPSADSDMTFSYEAISYTKALTDYLIRYTNESAIVKAQEENPTISVLSGLTFAPDTDAEKQADTITYLESLGISEKAAVMSQILAARGTTDMTAETQLAAMLDQFLTNDPDESTLLALYDAYVSPGTYEDNLTAFGVVSLDAPSSISIYVDSFEDKDLVEQCIQHYNQAADEDNQITYTDYVGLLMSSVTTIINVISYVLIAFVAVSLVVSSIMIGIITYISVLERTKEIGILRAIGASKRNISEVFNAETFIIGLLAGLIGIGITLLLLIPGNAIIHAVTGSTGVNAALPPMAGLILVVLSVVLTLIGGLIPSRKAAKKDPVTALRTE